MVATGNPRRSSLLWLCAVLLGLAAGGLNYLLATGESATEPGVGVAAEIAAMMYLGGQVVWALLVLPLAGLLRGRHGAGVPVRAALAVLGVLGIALAVANLSGSWAAVAGGCGQVVLIGVALVMLVRGGSTTGGGPVTSETPART
ncbi:MAG TPA: hypothetical protein VGH99_01065 [Pseudonocardia sp.]|jgi:hypothetical protein